MKQFCVGQEQDMMRKETGREKFVKKTHPGSWEHTSQTPHHDQISPEERVSRNDSNFNLDKKRGLHSPVCHDT